MSVVLMSDTIMQYKHFCKLNKLNLNRGKQGNKINEKTRLKYMSRLMGKPTICIGENKDADQLRGNCEADQSLCFRDSDSTIPFLLKFEIPGF